MEVIVSDLRHRINGKVVDFARAGDLLRPLDQWRVGDLKALEELGVRFEASAVKRFSPIESAALIYYLARRANKQISMADVDALLPEELGAIIVAIHERMLPPDKPEADDPGKAEAPIESPLPSESSGPLSSSAAPSAGLSTTSVG